MPKMLIAVCISKFYKRGLSQIGAEIVFTKWRAYLSQILRYVLKRETVDDWAAAIIAFERLQ